MPPMWNCEGCNISLTSPVPLRYSAPARATCNGWPSQQPSRPPRQRARFAPQPLLTRKGLHLLLCGIPSMRAVDSCQQTHLAINEGLWPCRRPKTRLLKPKRVQSAGIPAWLYPQCIIRGSTRCAVDVGSRPPPPQAERKHSSSGTTVYLSRGNASQRLSDASHGPLVRLRA